MKNFASLIFAKNAEKHGEIAICDKDGERRFSWDNIRDSAFRVASYARKKQLSGIVPVWMDRSFEAFITLLGLDLADVGVAPLSINTPAERVKQISSQVNNAPWTADDYTASQAADPDAEHWNATIKENEGIEADRRDDAYVVFTSGSTGNPKGVLLSSAAMIDSVTRNASRDYFDCRKEDIVLQTGAFSFIAVALDLFAPLYAGSLVHILPEKKRGDIQAITEYINRFSVTKVYLPPQLYHQFEGAKSLVRVITGSDRVVNIAPKGHTLVALYGMSETAGTSFAYEIKAKVDVAPLGEPCPNLRAYVVDENGALADEGEMCVSGLITHGYLNLPEMTQKAITPNPFCSEKGHEWLLHTGDIVRRIEEGSFRYLNRKDNMIKCNGQRIEPGEIEKVMLTVDPIRSAVVKGFTDDDGRCILCGFYVAEGDVDEDALKQRLAAKLPHYMVPSVFVKLDKMPLNANGKLDRRSLALPDLSAFAADYVAPENDAQKMLCEGFKKALCMEKIGIDDDFLRLGGDSISALTVVKLCEGLPLSAQDILTQKTPRRIAEKLQGAGNNLYENLTQGVDRALLTDSQMGIYLACLPAPESTMYNIPARMTFKREKGLSLSEIAQRVDNVLKTHPALYARIESEEDAVFMVRCPFPEKGICAVKEGDATKAESDWIRPLPLNQSPLCRAEAYVTENEIQLLLDTHHIVSDGTSIGILLRQFAQSLAGETIETETLDPFSLKEAEDRAKEKRAEDKQYFDALLSDVDTNSSLLFDRPDTQPGIKPCAHISFFLDAKDIISALKTSDITENTLFMGAFGYALAKMTGRTTSCFSVAENGRGGSPAENTVCMMVRTLPVVASFDEHESGRQYLAQMQQQFFSSMEHDHASFAELAREYGVSTDASFVYQAGMLSGNLTMLENRETFANLSCHVLKRENAYELRVEYRSDLYTENTIRRFAYLFESAARHLPDPDGMDKIPLTDEKEKQLLDSFNHPAETLPTDTVVDIFRKNAALYPDKTVLVFRDKKYTLHEADYISDCLAGYIHSLGIGREETVSILIPRCEWIYLGSLSVLKSGAIYQPLDPSYPPERINFMMQDAACKLLIADRSLVHIANEYTGKVLYLDEIDSLLTEEYAKIGSALESPALQDTFVLLYTSGTTGKPKGCMLSHANIRFFTETHMKTLGVDGDSCIASYASYGFDAHMADLYPALCAPCCFFVVPEEIRLDFPALKHFIEESGITHLFMTTQVARQFAMEYPRVEGLRCVNCGGEKLASFNPPENYRFLNLYGPTEGTVCMTGFPVDRYYENIPIGKVLGNNLAYIADACGRRVPVGVPGELIICGPQVAKGYLHRPDATEKAFVPNIYDKDAQGAYKRCYRTGDVVRYLETGDIEFIGRRDLQVKIRGFRIELSEVEKVIREYPNVTNAVVIAVDIPGGKAIHAYFTATEPIDISALNRFIKERKPAYMVPAASMQLDAFPMTTNQKVDKRKLPPIKVEPKKEGSAHRTNTVLEDKLLAILKEIVGEGDFAVDTEFADAGVTSITSIKLSTRIFKEFNLKISSKDILDGGSVLTVENAVVENLLSQKNAPVAEEKKALLSKYPLTQTQMGIYLDSMRAGLSAYNIPMLLKLPEGIDTERLKKALVAAVSAHPSMLCAIHPDENGDAALYPMPDMEIAVEEETISALPPEQTEFAFDENPLLRLRIITCCGEQYLFIEAHHIISDGESLAMLLRDADEIYRGNAVEKESFTAFELSLEEQTARNGAAFETAREYYDSVFQGVSNDYCIVSDRKEETCTKSRQQPIAILPESAKAFCKQCGVTENVLFTCAFAFTASKFTYHEDALFTTIYNGRTDPRTERMASMLVKTLPLLVSCAPEKTVPDFLKDTQQHLQQVKKHDIFSFADASRAYGLHADMMFIYQGKLMSETTLDGKPLSLIPTEENAPKAEISAQVYENENGYSLTLEYNAGRFSDALMASFADAYAECVKSLLRENILKNVSILSESALHRYDAINDTDISVPYEPAYRRIEQQAVQHPERVAVSACNEKGERECVTYRQLDNMANCLAHMLLALDVQSEEPVAVMTGRSRELHLAEYGILKSGGAFLFLSPAYPDERVSYIVKESGIRAIVTTCAIAKEKKALFDALSLHVLCADTIDPNVLSESPNLTPDIDSVAYLIYTSGSTGKPKGVMIKQRGILNILDDNDKNIELRAFLSERHAAVTAFTFDASVLDSIVSLANGVSVYIASDEEIHDPVAFTKMCLANDIRGMVCTPAFLTSLLDYDSFAEAVKQFEGVLVGGEAFPASLLEKLRAINPALVICNGYGPSETTIACTAKVLTDPQNITIGRPLNNYKVYPIDKQNRVLPMGALGELVILGEGVSKGYLGRPDLTEKAFITLMEKPAYKSGDLVRIGMDGEIEFHGRIDNQIKLNGLRIELGEIESAINACEDVKNSIVVVAGSDKNKFLAAYYTAEREISSDEITNRIAKTLAEYMVPRVLMQLDKMPLTANGKINKKELPAVSVKAQERVYTAPRSDTEKALCEAFEKALSMEKVGIDDDFFALGGSSLTATKVAMFALARGINVVYKDIFEHPTPRQLAALSGDALPEQPENAFEDDYTLSDKALSENVWHIGDSIAPRPLGNILLTGATGFLGMHMLHEFLTTRTGNVYCLLRPGEGISCEDRLTGMYIYYFGTSLEEQLGKRVFCVDGDITDAKRVEALQDIPFDTLINCAACVKHFASGDILENVNVKGVENLIHLCLSKGKRLIQVSTISVAGEGIDGKPDRNQLLHENELFFGQLLENQYIATKFRAEKLVLDAVAQGLDAKIMRAGNLMPRLSDGEFQINSVTNGFMRRLRGYYALGCIPYSQLAAELEFSPIDETAGAMLALAETDARFTVFHANNVHRVYMADVIRAMNEAGLAVEVVEEAVFTQKLQNALRDEQKNVGGLIAYLNRASAIDRYMLGYSNAMTGSVLNRIGYAWHITDDGYMVSALKQLKDMGFFEFDI